MAQPVSQNHMNPYAQTTDSSFHWSTFAPVDNKQMSGNNEVSAIEQRQRAAGMIPNRTPINDPRQTANPTTNVATTPITTSPVYGPAGGPWSVSLNDNHFQQQHFQDPYHLAPQQELLRPGAQYLPQYNQQLGQQQHTYDPQAAATYHPYHSSHHLRHLPQQPGSIVGYPPTSSPAEPAGLDRPLFPQHPENSSVPSTSEPRRPNKPSKHGRKVSNHGPLYDKTNRVQKKPAPLTPSHHLNITRMPGDIDRRYHKLMSIKGKFPDGQSPEITWPDLVEFILETQANIKPKTEPMSRDHSDRGQIPRDVSSVRDEPMTGSLSPRNILADRKEIARLYRVYQKEFRPRDSQDEFKFKCTLGCSWSHKNKSNWERHERTHYPQEIWICCHEGCLDKSHKTRVSFRKDLARRHHVDHHKTEGEQDLTDRQLDNLKVRVPNSLFPRDCVFRGCTKTFKTFNERSTHMEGHLKNGDVLERESIKHYEPDDMPQLDSDVDADHDMHDPGHGNFGLDPGRPETSNDEDDGEDDDGDDDNDGGTGGPVTKYDPGDRDGGTGAGGTGSSLWNAYGGTAGSSSHTNNTYQQQGYSPMSTNTQYGYACDFDTFGGSGHIPAIDKRPWKVATSLRLQLLPQVFARGIAQTPLVLKKIQLQAALMLDLSGVKKTQIINILRREIAIMASALPVSSGPSIKKFPHLTAMTKLLPSLTKTASRIDMSCMAKQNQAILKFAGFRKDILSQELEDPGGEDNDEEPADPLRDRLTHFEGGHIYRCLPIHSSMTRILPSRLVHVGTKNKPILHLDTSEALPSHVNYCSLSHCWDDGYGLCLSKENVTSLKHSIPADGLTQSFHVAINIAREKGLEYLWIDTLCIMQDSDEDIQAEVPKITQIHASATFAIVITSVSYDGDAQQCDESVSEDNVDWDEKSEVHSIPETPELTLGDTVETELDTANKTSQKDTSPVKVIHQLPVRRDSHQLESFLAEGPKRSFFSPLPAWDKISPAQSLSPVPSHSKFDPDQQVDDSDGAMPDKQPSRIIHYLDKWRFHWQKLPTQPAPLSSAASIITTSPAPSISDKSFYSEKKKKHPMFVLPVSFEKLFRGLRSRHTHDTDHYNNPGHWSR